MSMNNLSARIVAGIVGGAVLLGGTGAAFAAEVDDQNVDVSVDIAALPPVGALTMSVAADATTLTEVESDDANIRQFNGELPTVTVKDDRQDVPAGKFWYVLGQSSDLSGAAGTLPAGHLGWKPKLVASDGDGIVTEGPVVDTVLDDGANNVGLQGEELLALTLDSGQAAEEGTWRAAADLFLKTPADVAPGAYAGTITLTLWEDEVPTP